MLSDILTKEEKLSMIKEYREALIGLSEPINNFVKPKKKHFYIYPLRKAGLERVEAIGLGFKCSKHLWKSCLDRSFRKSGGRSGISESLQEAIVNHVTSQAVSEIAPNRIIKKRLPGPRNLEEEFRDQPENWRKGLNEIETELVPVYNRTVPLKEMYESFLNSYSFDEMPSITTFLKYVPKHSKKPMRKTDMCDYCEFARELKQNILKFTQENHEEFYETQAKNDEIDIKSYTEFYKNLENNLTESNLSSDDSSEDESNLDDDDGDVNVNKRNILTKLEDLKSIDFHKSVVKRQRHMYNLMSTDKSFFNDTIVIEFDFKQRIKYGIFLFIQKKEQK
jgi:hypothetical protein